MNEQQIAELNALAAQRDEWKRRNRYYHDALTRVYRFFVPDKQRVLEVGCGTGDLLVALKPAHGVGLDPSSTAVETACRKYADRNNVAFRQDEAETFCLNETFDYVIMADTIGFVRDVQRALENLRQVMTARSRLIINAHNFLWEPVLRLAECLGLKQKQPQQNWLAMSDMLNLIYLAGYEVVHREGFMLLPVGVPFLSAFINGFLAKLPLIQHLTVAQFIIARPVYQPPRELADQHTVSVLVPARNEAGNIEAALTRTPAMGAWTEMIFVEGGSSDNTWAEIQRVKEQFPDRRIKIMQQDGKGKADAVRKGFANAAGDILMILDADLTMPPEDLPKFYRAIADNKGEFVNGVRLVYPMEGKAMRLLNLYANKFFSLAFSFILGQTYKDTLCGTKVLWRVDYERLAAGRGYFGEFDPYGDFDLLFGAAKLNLRTVEIPIRYKERTYGETNISRFSGGWLLLRMAWIGFKKFKWNVR